MGSGAIGRQTAVHDVPQKNTDDVVRIVLDDFVNHLPEWQRSAVQMTVMANMTFREAAEHISVLRGVTTDRKTVWRWAKGGLDQILQWMKNSPWLAAITNDKIPLEYLDNMTESMLQPPWDDDASS